MTSQPQLLHEGLPLYRMMAVWMDGGVSTRSMGSNKDEAGDVFNLIVYGRDWPDLLYAAVIEIGAGDSAITRSLVWEYVANTDKGEEWENDAIIRRAAIAGLDKPK